MGPKSNQSLPIPDLATCKSLQTGQFAEILPNMTLMFEPLYERCGGHIESENGIACIGSDVKTCLRVRQCSGRRSYLIFHLDSNKQHFFFSGFNFVSANRQKTSLQSPFASAVLFEQSVSKPSASTSVKTSDMRRVGVLRPRKIRRVFCQKCSICE